MVKSMIKFADYLGLKEEGHSVAITGNREAGEIGCRVITTDWLITNQPDNSKRYRA
jgi:hypothetical protein